MRRSGILPKIFLLLALVVIVLLYNHQVEIRNILLYNTDRLKAYLDADVQIIRKRPVSTLKKETELQLYIGSPFTGFTRKEWNSFWDLVYGLYLREIPERPDLPKKPRQLTEEEIIQELLPRYSDPLAYFKEEHWKAVFGVIVGR
ncbi:MAG: hypothetical protein WC628_01590 [Candidatus Omnitrophota bacterium]